MNCPKCSAENTQKLQVVYEQGMSNINTVSKTNIKPFANILPTASAKTSTSGVSLTAAAQKAAPPAKKSFLKMAVAMFVLLVLSSMFFNTGIIWGLADLAIVAFLGYLVYTAVMFNKKVYPVQFEQWQKSWMCNKCGNIYLGE